MKKEKRAIWLTHLLETEVPEESVDLWPRIKRKLDAEMRPLRKGLAPSRPVLLSHFRNLQWAAGICLVILAATALIIATPQGRAIAQSIYRFFLQSEQNSKVLPSLESELVGVEEATGSKDPAAGAAMNPCGSVRMPGCSLLDAQKAVDFEILYPANLPESVSFTGAVPIHDGVLMKFEGSAGTLILAEVQTDLSDLQDWLIGKDARVENTMIGKDAAEYVVGGWAGLGLDEGNIIPWDEDIPTHVLRWQSGALQLTLVNFPSQGAKGPEGLEKQQLVAIAESLGRNRTAGDAEPRDSDIPLDQTETQAGFDYIEPDWLPEGFSLTRTTYNSQTNAICQYYRYLQDNSAAAMVIAQSSWALPPVHELQSKAYYGGEEVEIVKTETLLPIPGADGKSGVLVETGIQANAFCGGEPATANRALMWQKGARTYIIFAQQDANDGRGFVTIQELERIAEALSVPVTDQNTWGLPDPERLLSFKDAEELATFPVRMPTQILSGVVFDHMAYKVSAESGKLVTTMFVGQPVGDGRRYHFSIYQSPNSDSTLAMRRQAGGYTSVIVRAYPGIYQAQCWDSTILAGSIECHQNLVWFEGKTEYEIFTYFPAEVPKEKILAIAESMK